jgi:hypothetical protein
MAASLRLEADKFDEPIAEQPVLVEIGEERDDRLRGRINETLDGDLHVHPSSSLAVAVRAAPPWE